MKKNMGKADSIIRIIVALLIVGLYLGNVIGGVTAIVLLVIAGIFALTASVRVCPLYSIFGIKTNKEQ
jgi:hypothetical protein